MMIQFEAPGKERKHLAQVSSSWLGYDVKYCGAPSFAYEIGPYTLDRNGVLSRDGNPDAEALERMLQHLHDEGFQFKTLDAESEEIGMSISVPYDAASVDNLTKLLDTKGKLIKKALGARNVRLTMEDDRIVFDWFDRELTADEVNAYMVFITALCRLSKELKRVNTTEKPVENEKYAFRCFLLRLGFIGENYKGCRKILLSRLSGSSAFKGVGK